MALVKISRGTDIQHKYTDGVCCFANKLRKIFTQSAKKKWRLKGF